MRDAVIAAVLSAAPLAAMAADATDGLYVGYYQEDTLTNSEDPTPGSIYLSLPAGDSAFSGSMSLTYVGCQSENFDLGDAQIGEEAMKRWAERPQEKPPGP